eukprot:6193630-Pleurochrysis_carterae.AAC.2
MQDTTAGSALSTLLNALPLWPTATEDPSSANLSARHRAHVWCAEKEVRHPQGRAIVFGQAFAQYYCSCQPQLFRSRRNLQGHNEVEQWHATRHEQQSAGSPSASRSLPPLFRYSSTVLMHICPQSPMD